MMWTVCVENSMHIEFCAFFGTEQQAKDYAVRANRKGLHAVVKDPMNQEVRVP